MRGIALSPEPIVRLENYFKDSFDNAVATARTCYSSRVVTSEDVHKDEKSRERGKVLGADDYFIKKDMTIKSLLDMVEKVQKEWKKK